MSSKRSKTESSAVSNKTKTFTLECKLYVVKDSDVGKPLIICQLAEMRELLVLKKRTRRAQFYIMTVASLPEDVSQLYRERITNLREYRF